MKKIIILLFLVFLLSSCYDYKELDDMSIVNSIGIDYVDNEYVVYLEINNSVKKNGDNQLIREIIEAKDKNIALAYSKAVQKSNKILYAEHVNLLLLSKSVSENGIDDVINYILRDLSINNNYMTVIADNPKSILNMEQDNDSISNIIKDTIKYHIGNSYNYDIDLVASNLLNRRINIALPFVEVDNNNVLCNKIAWFKNDKLVSIDDNKIYDFMVLNSNSINFDKDGNVINIYDKKIDYVIEKDKIIIEISGNGNINDINKIYNLKEFKDYEELEDIIEDKIKEEIISNIDYLRNKDIDMLGLKDKYYREFKLNKNNISYEVKVKIKLNKNGSTYEVIHG